jgi:hypothetical protein
MTVALGLSLGQVPYQSNGSYTPGAPAGAETGLQASATGGQYGHEEMYPYDAYDNWVHGHFQEIPAYGGYHFFRPYNYKHVLSQSQTSGGWACGPGVRRARLRHSAPDSRLRPQPFTSAGCRSAHRSGVYATRARDARPRLRTDDRPPQRARPVDFRRRVR